MEKDIRNRIELWLESLGYSFNNQLYSQVEKMSYYRPSYKIMADTVLKSIKNNNLEINSNEAWRYTTKFVNGMKSNLIVNNNYFQKIFKDGLFNPHINEQDGKVNLLTSEMLRNNSYNYLKNISISNGKENNMFDFIIVINGFPLILIEIIDKNNSSFDQAFLSLEKNFEEYPMFFNFNKLNLLTDGTNYKLGTLYDFPEDYILFGNQTEYSEGMVKYSIKQLENILSDKNILRFLKTNKTSKEIHDFIDNNLKKQVETTLKKDEKRYEFVIDEFVNH